MNQLEYPRRTTAAGTESWIVPPKPNPDALLSLFCFPHAGGGVSAFHAWPDALPVDLEVLPVQLPGREGSWAEPPYTELPALLEALAPVLRAYLGRPFVFFGHSMGALIAFELARRLAERGEATPEHLFVSGIRAPQLADPEPPLAALPEAEFLAELASRYGQPDELLHEPELAGLLAPVLRADMALCESYAYAVRAPLECPITAFGGLDDRKVTGEQLAAWREQTRGPFTLRMFPGDHFFLHRDAAPFLRVLGKQLTRLIRRMCRGG
jgi:medium-chain acyl-[acyl-carrier-protein] hydrolase